MGTDVKNFIHKHEIDFSLFNRTIETAESCTLDCPECGELCIVEKGKVLDFHKVMHADCEEWPVDGKGTSFIEM